MQAPAPMEVRRGADVEDLDGDCLPSQLGVGGVGAVVRVLVCGGRRYDDLNKVWDKLNFLHRNNAQGITCLIHGGATGADTLGGYWAVTHGVAFEEYKIQPGEGGYARNGRMLLDSRPDLVVHFPGGNGTRDMVRRARKAGVRVLGGLSKEAGGGPRQDRLF